MNHPSLVRILECLGKSLANGDVIEALGSCELPRRERVEPPVQAVFSEV